MNISTPIGPVWLGADEYGLTFISFVEKTPCQTNAFTQQAAKELIEYFSGQRTYFDVPLSIQSGTAFQRNVWQVLTCIPYGFTKTYQEIAQIANSPKAVRAVGQANSKNPLPIILPCHRVIGKNGALTGYLGAADFEGVVIKQKLLALEKNFVHSSPIETLNK